MAVVVLVHGIGQEQMNVERLEAAWVAGLASGLEAAGFDDIARAVSDGRVPVRMAFYGDLFRTAGAMGAGEDELLTDDLAVMADALGREWLDHALARSSDEGVRSDAAVAAAALNASGEEDMGVRSAMRELSAQLARVRWFARPTFAVAERVVRRALQQVTAYMGDVDNTREQALGRVADLIDEEAAIVVGHSLGSVVAYEAAQRLGQSLPLLVTLGSPLGLDTIIFDRLVPQPPSYPSMVRRWVNVADLDDLVAADPNLRPRFQPPAGGWLESLLVKNASPHGAVDYLSTPEAGRPIGELLARS